VAAPADDVVASRLRLFKRVARLTAYPIRTIRTNPKPANVASALQTIAGAEAIRAGFLSAYPTTIGDIQGLENNQELWKERGGRAYIDAANMLANGARSVLTNATPAYTYEPTGQAIDITGLRIRFEVEKSVSRHPNKTEIWVTNLSAESRKLVQNKPIAFSLEVGYDDVYRMLASGDLHFGKSEYKRPDWETMVQLSEGGTAFNFARVNKSYRRGTPLSTILKDVSGAMGFTLPDNISSDVLNKQIATGTVVLGAARDELTRLLAPYGYHWSNQGGRLQVLADEEVGDLNPILVSQETGMIGSPAYGNPTKSDKPPTLHVKMLLYPGIVPGNPIQVVSLTESGYFRVEKVKHVGDTHGDDWYTQIECRPCSPQSATGDASIVQQKPGDIIDGLGSLADAAGQVLSVGASYLKDSK
jgi:hypothetical protein